jgi:hypothetical protein
MISEFFKKKDFYFKKSSESCYQSIHLQQKRKINSLDRTGEDEATKQIEIERQRKVEGEIERG